MGCLCGLAAGVIKYLMFAANVLFMLSGIAIIALGSVILDNFKKYENLLKGNFDATAISIIVVGSIICVIGFCGCCGAIRKSVCLLNIYAVLLTCVFIAEIAIGIVALQQVGTSQDYVREHFATFFKDEYKDDGKSEVFDDIHKKFSCCAVTGPSDFNTIFTPPITVPDSCKCNPIDTTVCDSQSLYKNGCTNGFTTWVEEGVRSVGIVSLCVAACEIIAIVFACCLSTRFKKQKSGGV